MDLDTTSLLISVGLLGLAALFVVLEVFLVSFGLLLLAAIVCAAGAVRFAFVAHDFAGWASLVVIPLGGAFAARWGLAHLRTSRTVVAQDEITASAGQEHVAERLALAPGVEGVLVTPARPSGRARFERGECDVQVHGPTLDAGARVAIERIDGPVIFVTAAPSSAGEESNPNPETQTSC